MNQTVGGAIVQSDNGSVKAHVQSDTWIFTGMRVVLLVNDDDAPHSSGLNIWVLMTVIPPPPSIPKFKWVFLLQLKLQGTENH